MQEQVCPCRSFKIRMYQFSDIFCFCECKDSDRLLSGRLSGDGLCDRGGRKKFDLTLFLSVLVICIDNKHAFSIYASNEPKSVLVRDLGDYTC